MAGAIRAGAIERDSLRSNDVEGVDGERGVSGDQLANSPRRNMQSTTNLIMPNPRYVHFIAPRSLRCSLCSGEVFHDFTPS